MRLPLLMLALLAVGFIGAKFGPETPSSHSAVQSTAQNTELKIAMEAIGCVSEQDFDDWARARSQGDKQSAAAIQLARCRWLLTNERVTLIERRVTGNVQILYRGERLWTHKAAVGI